MNKEDLERVHKKFLSKLSKTIPLNLNYNCKYTAKKVFEPLVYAAVENVSLETSNDELSNIPNSDTVFYHIKKLEWEEVLRVFQMMVRENYFQMRRIYRLTGEVKIAIDFHDIPYYGKDKCVFIVRGKKKSGTTKFYRIATVDIVERGRRFTMAVIPINTFKRLEKVIEELLLLIKGLIRVRCSLMDRGFQSIEVFKTLKRKKKKFITPAKKTKKVIKVMDECARRGKCKVLYRLQNNQNFVDIFLMIYPTKDGDLVGFFTNMNVSPEWVANAYPYRWGIETGYRVKKGFRAKTCSRSFVVRLFYVLLSIFLYNLWVSVNIERFLLDEKPIAVRKIRVSLRRLIERGIW